MDEAYDTFLHAIIFLNAIVSIIVVSHYKLYDFEKWKWEFQPTRRQALGYNILFLSFFVATALFWIVFLVTKTS